MNPAPGGMAGAAALAPAQEGVISSGSWGAAIFTWFYLAFMRAYPHALIAFLLSFVPVVNLIVWVYYIVKGKQLAWTNRPWRDFDNFLACQRIWDTWAKAVFFISLGIGVIFVLFMILGYMVAQS